MSCIIILFFSILAMPGVYIGGELINFVDIYIPLVFFIACKINGIKKDFTNISFIIYIILCLFSIIFYCIYNNIFVFSAFLKWLRLFYVLMIIKIIRNYKNIIYNYECSLYKVILYSGIFTAIFGIIIFLTQTTLFQTNQTMVYLGKVMYRAGGVFTDAGSYSLILVMIISVCIELLRKKIFTMISFIALLCSSVALVFTDNRTAIISILVLAMIWIFGNKKITLGGIVTFIGIPFLGAYLYNHTQYINRLFKDRVFPVFQAIFFNDNVALRMVSSNRFELWSNRLNAFWNSNIWTIFFGTGYKIGIESIGDNGFITCLTSSGILSLCAFLCFFLSVLVKMIRKNKKTIIDLITRDLLIIFTIYMFTSDAMTMTRPLYFLFSFLVLENLI